MPIPQKEAQTSNNKKGKNDSKNVMDSGDVYSRSCGSREVLLCSLGSARDQDGASGPSCWPSYKGVPFTVAQDSPNIPETTRGFEVEKCSSGILFMFL